MENSKRISTGVLDSFEREGYRFQLADDRLMVEGPDQLLSGQALDRLRQRKPEILAECRLRAFVDLVRSVAACEHQILLHRKEIEGELDADDLAALLQAELPGRQAWAGMLAFRLSNRRMYSA